MRASDHPDVIQVSVEQIALHLPEYLRLVEQGETLLVVRAGQPLAEIKPVVSEGKARRPFGLGAGEFTVPDDFDAPLPEHVLRAFETA